MKIAIGCDHGGLVLKSAVINAVKGTGNEVLDLGTYDTASVDYPDYAYAVCKAIVSGEADKGVLMCGTGVGISIAANKIHGIRCAHVTDAFSAKMSVNHNDANVLALGGRITTSEDANNFTRIFLTEKFDGGRHMVRVDKVMDLEKL